MNDLDSPSEGTPPSVEDPNKMRGNRKFIVTKDGRIFFSRALGKYDIETHEAIARREGLKDEEVVGGGLADCDSRFAHGFSGKYGTYNLEEVQKLLPHWRVLPSERDDNPSTHE